MSAAAAKSDDATHATEAAPASKGLSKKLIIIIAAAVLAVVAMAAVVAVLVLQRPQHASIEEAEDAEAAEAEAEMQRKKEERARKPPVFVPLDPFTVNLADRDQDRYMQVGMILEIDDPKLGEQMKTFMPAIRNGILMTLAHKTSKELLERQGKEKLATEVMREVVRPLQVEDDPENLIRAVHFSSFIIQ